MSTATRKDPGPAAKGAPSPCSARAKHRLLLAAGVGPKIGPRLLSHFGTDRSRFASAESVEQLRGAAPVTARSGRSKRVRMRRQCRKDFRNTLHQWAHLTTARSVWARAFYD